MWISENQMGSQSPNQILESKKQSENTIFLETDLIFSVFFQESIHIHANVQNQGIK